MAYDLKRYDTLTKLGIEQLPPMHCLELETHQAFVSNLPVRTMPVSHLAVDTTALLEQDHELIIELQVPGRKCPNCLSRGQTVWVIPGKRCPQCGTEVN